MMKYKRYSFIVFTALLAAFLVHNFEEAIMICSTNIHSPFEFIQPPSCKQFILMVVVVSIAGILAYIFAIHSNNAITYVRISNVFASVLLINVFVPHVIIAIYTLAYTPGLVSALLLTLPLSILLLVINNKHLHFSK